MFRDPQEMRRRLQEIIEKFRQKGATSPEKALTLEEVGLPPRFQQAMNRRLGQTGIFVKLTANTTSTKIDSGKSSKNVPTQAVEEEKLEIAHHLG